MEMSGKDGNIQGICPELHFFGFFQTMLSPVSIEEIHPSWEESRRIELGVHFSPVASSGTNRGWGERAMHISRRTTVNSHCHQWPNPARSACSPVATALERVEPKLSQSPQPPSSTIKPGSLWSPISCPSNFWIADWARAELGIEISIRELMRAFTCSRHAVQSAVVCGLNEPKSRRRHMAVDAESDANILAWIKRKAEKSAKVTWTNIKNYCREVCKFQVSRGWVDSFISRHADELTEKTSSPQEETRLQVPRVVLEETIWTIHETILGRPSELVFNLDEIGIFDWEDRRPKKVLIAITARSQYSSSNISERETHFDCSLHIRKWRDFPSTR
jgi:hypothetical protein